MPFCCAVGCSNSSKKGFKLFQLPTGKNDTARRKLWLSRIKRAHFKPKHAYLCQEHFEDDEFERNVPGKLKRTAVPAIFSHRPTPKHRKPRSRPDEDSQLISTAGTDGSGTARVLDEHSYSHIKNQRSPAEQLDKNVDEAVCLEEKISLPVATTEILRLVTECRPMVQPSIEDLLETVKTLKNNLQTKRKEIQREKSKQHFLQARIEKLFNSDQLQFLEHSEKRPSIIWTDETIQKAVKIHHICGSTGYCLLLKEGFPLPSERTLRRRLQRLRTDNAVAVNNDIVSEVMQMLAQKDNCILDVEEKNLSFDEAAIQHSLDCDLRSRSIVEFPIIQTEPTPEAEVKMGDSHTKNRNRKSDQKNGPEI